MGLCAIVNVLNMGRMLARHRYKVFGRHGHLPRIELLHSPIQYYSQGADLGRIYFQASSRVHTTYRALTRQPVVVS